MREFYSVEDDYSTCVEDLEPMVTTVNHERESGRIVVEGQRACVGRPEVDLVYAEQWSGSRLTVAEYVF